MAARTKATVNTRFTFRIERLKKYCFGRSYWVSMIPILTNPVSASIGESVCALMKPASRSVLLNATSVLTGLFLVTGPSWAEGPLWRLHVIDSSSIGADGVRLADANGDGLLDVVTGWEEGGRIRICIHPGHQHAKSPWPAATVGEVSSPEDAVWLDMDADGRLDVLSSCEGGTRSLFVHWAPSDPELFLEPTAWKTGALPASQGRLWMFAVPCHLDGRFATDFIAGAKGTRANISLFLSPKNPRDLSAWKPQFLRRAGWIMTLRMDDMDDDGDPDLLFSDRRGDRRGVGWLENPGLEGVRAGQRWKEHDIGLSGQKVMFIDRADLDEDGNPEVVAALYSDRLAILQQKSAQAWDTQFLTLPAWAGTGKAVKVADVDEDGYKDILFTCGNARNGKVGVGWYPGGKAGGDWQSARPPEPLTDRTGIKFDRIELLDLDGDGDLDLMTCEEAERLGVIWYENPLR